MHESARLAIEAKELLAGRINYDHAICCWTESSVEVVQLGYSCKLLRLKLDEL